MNYSFSTSSQLLFSKLLYLWYQPPIFQHVQVTQKDLTHKLFTFTFFTLTLQPGSLTTDEVCISDNWPVNWFFGWVGGLPQLIEDASCLELRSTVYKCVVPWELVVEGLNALVVVDVIQETLEYEDVVQ